jgi:hypothetical protein
VVRDMYKLEEIGCEEGVHVAVAKVSPRRR